MVFPIFIFCASSSNHCLAAFDLRTGVEQPFDCLIVQNRQAVQFIRRSMDWTLEDSMVHSLFFCATLTACRGGHAPFVQAGAESPDTCVEAVKPDPCCAWQVQSRRVGAGVGDGNVKPCRVVRPLRILLAICPVYMYVVVVKWMSRSEAPCVCTRWTGECWVEQVSRLHGTAS